MELDSDVKRLLYCEAQLRIVSGGARPAWLDLRKRNKIRLISRAKELGLKILEFEGNGKIIFGNHIQFSGILYYNPILVDIDEIEHLKVNGWGHRSSNEIIGRLLGYDCPGTKLCRGQIHFLCTFEYFRRKPKERYTFTKWLFYYDVTEISSKAILYAADLSQQMRKSLSGLSIPELEGGNWKTTVSVSYNSLKGT